jgi:hypothetical protein
MFLLSCECERPPVQARLTFRHVTVLAVSMVYALRVGQALPLCRSRLVASESRHMVLLWSEDW